VFSNPRVNERLARTFSVGGLDSYAVSGLVPQNAQPPETPVRLFTDPGDYEQSSEKAAAVLEALRIELSSTKLSNEYTKSDISSVKEELSTVKAQSAEAAAAQA
jgi:predicted FMN-binding regulatory protein PaiB